MVHLCFALVLLQLPPQPEKRQLAEKPKQHAVIKSELSLHLEGTATLERGGKLEAAPIQASARHVYLERIGKDQTIYRSYSLAQFESQFGMMRLKKGLSERQRYFVFSRDRTRLLPRGLEPLTRDEFSLVAEHFDTSRLPLLLPSTPVQINQEWKIDDQIVADLCMFDTLKSHSLTGRLVEITGARAMLSIEGKAEGNEEGASVEAEISARGELDCSQHLIQKLTWTRSDRRTSGPVSPAMETKTTIELQRELHKFEASDWPEDLLERLDQLRRSSGELRIIHSNQSFVLPHHPDWHAVAETDQHVVFRLVRGGEWIAQVTITPWPAAKPGQNRQALEADFAEAARKQPGWEPLEVEETLTQPGSAGSTILRITARGRQDRAEVIQAFHLLTAANGRQIVLTCICLPDNRKKLQGADLTLAQSLMFPEAK